MIKEFLRKCDYIELTNTEKAIRDYILNNPESILEFGVKELSDACYVGVASVGRFCKKLGYDGYSDFKVEYIKSYNEELAVSSVDQASPFDADTRIDEIIEAIPIIYQRAIGYTRVAINNNTIIRCVEYLKSSNILIYGTGMNHSLAQTFSYKLEELGINCKVFDSVHYQYIMALAQKKKPMFAIVMTHSGRNASMLKAIERLNEANIPFVVITGNINDTLRRSCSNIISIIPVSNTRELSNIQFMISTQYILDILYVALFVKNIDEIEKISKKTFFKGAKINVI